MITFLWVRLLGKELHVFVLLVEGVGKQYYMNLGCQVLTEDKLI